MILLRHGTIHDYAIPPVHTVWTEDKPNHLFHYMVHKVGIGGKDLSDLQVYVTVSADAVPCCRRNIRLSKVDVSVSSFTTVSTDQPMCPHTHNECRTCPVS
jgi:hypothetical protein